MDLATSKQGQALAISILYQTGNAVRTLAPLADAAADFVPVAGELWMAYQVGHALYEGGKPTSKRSMSATVETRQPVNYESEDVHHDRAHYEKEKRGLSWPVKGSFSSWLCVQEYLTTQSASGAGR